MSAISSQASWPTLPKPGKSTTSESKPAGSEKPTRPKPLLRLKPLKHPKSRQVTILKPQPPDEFQIDKKELKSPPDDEPLILFGKLPLDDIPPWDSESDDNDPPYNPILACTETLHLKDYEQLLPQ